MLSVTEAPPSAPPAVILTDLLGPATDAAVMWHDYEPGLHVAAYDPRRVDYGIAVEGLRAHFGRDVQVTDAATEAASA